MGELAVRLASLEINNAVITDWKSVTIKGVNLYRVINLPLKTLYAKLRAAREIEMDYLVPEEDEVDFEEISNARLTLEFSNGKRRTFIKVYPTVIGDQKLDEDNDPIKTITFSGTLVKE